MAGKDQCPRCGPSASLPCQCEQEGGSDQVTRKAANVVDDLRGARMLRATAKVAWKCGGHKIACGVDGEAKQCDACCSRSRQGGVSEVAEHQQQDAGGQEPEDANRPLVGRIACPKLTDELREVAVVGNCRTSKQYERHDDAEACGGRQQWQLFEDARVHWGFWAA